MVPKPLTYMLLAVYPLKSPVISRENKVWMLTKPDLNKPMEAHRLASGSGKAIGQMGGEDADFYNTLLRDLQAKKKIGTEGVIYEPYDSIKVEGSVLALVVNDQAVEEVRLGQTVQIMIPKTGFYIESGGQVSDTGLIRSLDNTWEIAVQDIRKPAAGVIVHVGEVVSGNPKVGDLVLAEVDMPRRRDIIVIIPPRICYMLLFIKFWEKARARLVRW